MIRITGGKVLVEDGFLEADVMVNGERVVEVGSGPDGHEEIVIEASGCLVGPGFVDLHTHLRDPGQTWKEDLESGTRAAAAGGFTGVVAMPNTDPPLDDPKLVSDLAERGREMGLVELSVAAALTRGRAGGELAELEDLYEAGARIFTDDGDAVASPRLLAEALRRLAELPGAVLAQHAEDPDLSAAAAEPPVAAEVEMVRRDLELLAEDGGRYHCQHVSAAATVELIRRARDAGLEVTSEVTPHHLTFDTGSGGCGDPNFKMYPPLRNGDDRAAVVEALADGVIDAVATDHAPHGAGEKQAGWERAPRGVIGLETAAAAAWEALRDPLRLFRALSLAPARIAGLAEQGRPLAPGVTANLVVFDPSVSWVAKAFASRSRNSPYLGRSMLGRPVATIHRGRLTHRGER